MNVKEEDSAVRSTITTCNSSYDGIVVSSRIIGSGMYHTDHKVTLNVHTNNSNNDRKWRCTSKTDTHTKEVRMTPPTTSAADNEEVLQFVFEDESLALSIASDASRDAKQSLKDIASLPSTTNCDDERIGLPQLTTLSSIQSSSTSSSSSSSSNKEYDTSPASSICSIEDSITRKHSHHQQQQDDDAYECCSSTDSFCSSREEEIKDDRKLDLGGCDTHQTSINSEIPCARSPPDIYGQQHPIETESLIATKLHEFDLYIQNAIVTFHNQYPKQQQEGEVQNEPKFMIAERTCPDITTSSFKLMFLRCECYHVEKSIIRYTKYWEKRVELFGPNRAYQPITAQSLYDHNDHMALEIGSVSIIHRTNPNERNLLWFDCGKLDPTKYTRESGCRAFWYIFHSYIEDEEVQKKGMICLAFCQHFTLKTRDPTFTRMCIQSLHGCIPIRISAFHGWPPRYFRCAIPFFLLLIGEQLRKRILPHAGTHQHVNTILETKYNINKQYVPTDAGGRYQLNTMMWIQQRKDAGL